MLSYAARSQKKVALAEKSLPKGVDNVSALCYIGRVVGKGLEQAKNRKELDRVTMNTARIEIGGARREGRAASHDGEFIMLAWDNRGHWLIEDNGGVVADSEQGGTYLDTCGEEATEEDEQIQQEIDGYLATCPPPGGATVGLGGQARGLARSWGWPIADA